MIDDDSSVPVDDCEDIADDDDDLVVGVLSAGEEDEALCIAEDDVMTELDMIAGLLELDDVESASAVELRRSADPVELAMLSVLALDDDDDEPYESVEVLEDVSMLDPLEASEVTSTLTDEDCKDEDDSA